MWIGPRAYALRAAKEKLIVRGDDLPERFLDSPRRRAIKEAVGHLPPEMLFRFPEDQEERVNLALREPPWAASLRDRLRAHRAGLAPPQASAEGGRIAVEGDVLDRLRALGYVE